MNPESLLRIFAFILVSIYCTIGAECPRPSKLGDAIDACVRRQILLKNKSAFIGIDMERLRVMCSEFYSTVRCLGELAASCPEQSARFIEIRINSQQDFPHKELMHKLCTTQDLYEKYSIQFFCINDHKRKLHQCYHTFEKSIEPFVNSHDMTAQVCRPVDALMSCMDSVMTSSCSGEATNLLRSLVGPLMPHGVDVTTCPALTGEDKKVETKSPEKTSPEHYKVLYDNKNSNSAPGHVARSSFVLITCFLLLLARDHHF